MNNEQVLKLVSNSIDIDLTMLDIKNAIRNKLMVFEDIEFEELLDYCGKICKEKELTKEEKIYVKNFLINIFTKGKGVFHFHDFIDSSEYCDFKEECILNMDVDIALLEYEITYMRNEDGDDIKSALLERIGEGYDILIDKVSVVYEKWISRQHEEIETKINSIIK